MAVLQLTFRIYESRKIRKLILVPVLDLVVVWLHGHGDEQGDVDYKSSNPLNKDASLYFCRWFGSIGI